MKGKDVAAFSSGLFSAVVEAMTAASGETWVAEPSADAQLEGPEAERFRLELKFAGGLQGSLFVELDRVGACVWASVLLGKPVKKMGAPQAEALLKVIHNAANSFRGALAPMHGALTVEVAAASGSLASDCVGACFVASGNGEKRVPLLISVAPELAAALNSGGAASVPDSAKAAREQVNLDLVLDVELNVTLRFGQRLLTLREVLDLTSGSVVELDRHVEEPVELLLEGKVIARGEAVVIDGNYGLRVTDVPQAIARETLLQGAP